MKNIAFVTWSGEAALQEDDQRAADALALRGHVVSAIPWDKPAEWHSFDAVVLRSTWNYHLELDAFLEWLGELERARTPLFNSASLVRWNTHKAYLLELEQSGVLIPPTILVRRAEVKTLSTILAERAWEKAVVKPAVSANALNTFRVTIGSALDAQQQFEHFVQSGDILVQALVSEIYDEGELSLVFLDGDFSHAIRKRPRTGDFLVQESRGGKWAPEQVDRRIVEKAASILRVADNHTLYARVDGILTQNGFVLLELELIEPSLFFGAHPGAEHRFAAALEGRIC